MLPAACKGLSSLWLHRWPSAACNTCCCSSGHIPHPPCPPATILSPLQVLPPPMLMWKWGWTKSAETWNGRIAMLALVLILLLEATTGQGVVARLLEVHGLTAASTAVSAVGDAVEAVNSGAAEAVSNAVEAMTDAMGM